MKTVVAMANLSMLLRYCYAAMLLCCLTTPALAQGPADMSTTDASIYRIRDTWTYLTGRADGRADDTTVKTVVSVTESQTTIRALTNGHSSYEIVLNGQGDMVRSGDMTWEPAQDWLSFPMMVGKSWHFHDLKRARSGTADIDEAIKVVSFERVQVRAGTFDAYKLVIHGVFERHLGDGSAGVRCKSIQSAGMHPV